MKLNDVLGKMYAVFAARGHIGVFNLEEKCYQQLSSSCQIYVNILRQYILDILFIHELRLQPTLSNLSALKLTKILKQKRHIQSICLVFGSTECEVFANSAFLMLH